MGLVFAEGQHWNLVVIGLGSSIFGGGGKGRSRGHEIKRRKDFHTSKHPQLVLSVVCTYL